MSLASWPAQLGSPWFGHTFLVMQVVECLPTRRLLRSLSHAAAVASQLADLAADCMCTSRRRRPDLAAVVRPKLEQLAQAAAAAARPADAPVPFVEPPQEYLCPISQVSEGAARVGLCPGYKQGVDLQRHQPETTTSCGHMF